MSELFIVEVNDGLSWIPTCWTGVIPAHAKAVERPDAETALATAQRKFPNEKFRIAPEPTEGA